MDPQTDTQTFATEREADSFVATQIDRWGEPGVWNPYGFSVTKSESNGQWKVTTSRFQSAE